MYTWNLKNKIKAQTKQKQITDTENIFRPLPDGRGVGEIG